MTDDYLDKYEGLRVAIRYKLEIGTGLRWHLTKSLADEIVEMIIEHENTGTRNEKRKPEWRREDE